MASEDEKAVVDQTEETPQPQAEETAALPEELDEASLEQVSGGYRVVGGVIQYSEGEKDFYICKNSKNPFGKHKWQRTGEFTKKWNGFTKDDAELIKCIWCGYTWSKYVEDPWWFGLKDFADAVVS